MEKATERTYVYIFAGLALILLGSASLAGILLDDGGGPYSFTSLRGEVVEVYGGMGLYRYDNVYKAVLFRGFDWANLVVGIPLLILGIVMYRGGQLKGQLLLASVFAYLAYNYMIGVMGNAFNNLFLVWTALYATGLFGLALVVVEINLHALPGRLESNFPRKGLAIYVFALAAFLLVQYFAEILTAYTGGQPPATLDHYTTLELAALELGIMIPLHILGGALLWQGRPAGYLLAIVLAFTAWMTFISLSAGGLIFYFWVGRGSAIDVAVPLILAVIAGVFTVLIFNRTRN